MAFEHGHALIIGVGEYIHHPGSNIPMASEDARRIAGVLAEKKLCGYLPEYVSLLTDQQASRDAVLQALSDLSNVGANDTVLLFFSGHGALGTDGNYYLTTCDSRFSSGRVVKGTGISEGELLGLLRKVPAKKMILLIHACFAGALSPHFGPEEEAEVESANLPNSTADAILGSGEGRIIITSSREGQRSWGKGGQKTSFFAQALVDGLKGRARYNAGYIGAFGLYEHVYETVKEAAEEIGQEQEPELTVLKGIGPFPVALYRGAREPQTFDADEELPEESSVRRVSERTSQRAFIRITSINTGGGSHIGGNVDTGGGDFVGRDQNKTIVHGSISGGTLVVGNQNTVNAFPDPEETAQKQREKARRAYLRELRATCNALPLAALGEDEGTGADIRLDHIYVDLDTTALILQGDEEHKDKYGLPGSLQEKGKLSALEAAKQTKRLALLGDPGAGKSTFVRRLAAWLAAAGLGEAKPPEGFEANLMPILVTLRELAPKLRGLNLEALPDRQRQKVLLDALHEQIRAELDVLGNDAPSYADDLLKDLSGGRCLLILDGMDEVPNDLRERVRQAVAFVINRYQVKHIILTCRIRSYSGSAVFSDFVPYTLAPFDAYKIRSFSQAWYNTQLELKKTPGKEQANKRAEDLASAALALEEMGSNPMLLTSMAIIHQRDIGLPDQRVMLYSLIVDVLARRWQKHKTGEQGPSKELGEVLKNSLSIRIILERLGYEAHLASASQERKVQVGDLRRARAIEVLESRAYLGSAALASEFLDYLDQRAGLLAGFGGEQGQSAAYGFPHRSLQEYLAGCYLVGQLDPIGALYQHADEGEGWDLAVQLGLEEMYYNRRNIKGLLDLTYQVSATFDVFDDSQQRMLLWAGQAASLVGAENIEQYKDRPRCGKPFLDRIRGQMVNVMAGTLPPIERSEAGNALARLGDPRPEVINIDHMQLCLIPFGSFLMGARSKKEKPSFKDEQPQHFVELSAFWIGRQPITNAQFDAFAYAGGYAEARFWEEAIEAGYWDSGSFKGEFDSDGRTARLPVIGSFDLSNHPVVGVTWYEALAFTRWLDHLAHKKRWLNDSWVISLPSEAEWEKAARGGIQLPVPNNPFSIVSLNNLPAVLQNLSLFENPDIGRMYPWEGDFDRSKVNTEESGINATSSVGCFPGGASPYGVLDMGSNVWEWTRSLWGGNFGKSEWGYPYNPTDEKREELKARAHILRVIRGGSWQSSGIFARCAFRLRSIPHNENLNIGFRVVVLPSTL